LDRVVDVHSHLYPRAYVELLKARTEIPRVVGDLGDERFVIFRDEETDGSGGRPMGPEYWDPAEKLRFMDRFGIAQTVLSLGNPWLDPFEGDESLEAARLVNAEFEELWGRTEGRLIGLGALPTSVADALVVAEEIAEAKSLVGVVSGVRVCRRPLDSEDLEPLWLILEERALPMLLHPHYAVAPDELGRFGHALPVGMGFPLETSIALALLIFGGVFQRHPRLRIVASHGGGTIPYLAGRLDAAWASDPDVQDRLPEPPSRDFAKLYLDALLYHERAMRAAADLVGEARMMFGSDHPFSVADPEANLRAIDAAFQGESRSAVLEGTARVLYDLASPGEPGAEVRMR
jgi:aminocarboxymuconate-semialdehyde decarboxylase